MILPINSDELDERIALNCQRLAEGDYYHIDQVFSPADYEWYGDKEGRALLAFVSHYKMSGVQIPCMAQMLEQMDAHLNADGYFGPVFEKQIHEQQLSGHSWLLRGLCEYYTQFGDAFCERAIRRIVENLYLPKVGRFSSYPVHRGEAGEGGVSGVSVGAIADWILSSDIGCAFMSIDGLSHAYGVLKDERIRRLLDEMIEVYLGIDKVQLKAQTHCTLTAARGMARMYSQTGLSRYLEGAEELLDLYANGGGMSATYQNLNWWGRPDTWTEPCAIVDSLMLATELYKCTERPEYRTLAARIYHNGLATAQRPNGGAGTDSVVLDGVNDDLFAKLYEAYFCCTMRLAEVLWYIRENREALYAELEGAVRKRGRVYADGDLLYAEVSGGAEAYAEKTVQLDGHILSPLVKYYRVPEEILRKSKQKILF